ncbi:MAG: hypothetical protein JSV85_05485 [Candidatus Bathyarchaeota archaeon]|nr:MAG: hypothetical protein JSV85_05485 [Candidatus Bathyarchaeota archaeon]
MISIYLTYELPAEEYVTFPLFTYQHTGQFDYTAKLTPNTLYNKTTLGPGQGTLYTKIIDYINITFTYRFTCSHPTNITSMEYQVDIELESPGKNWTKAFTTTEILETFQLVNAINSTERVASTTLLLNHTQIDKLVGIIDGEIGTSKSLQYNLAVEPEIHLVAETIVGEENLSTIYDAFAPNLIIEFAKKTPNHISIEDLEHAKPTTITGTRQSILQSVVNWRLVSILAAVIAIPMLSVTAWFYLKTKPPTPLRPIEETVGPHKELIAETTQKPPETTQTIDIKTLEDLAKVSEALVKPILHNEETEPKGKTTHIFYILDRDTKYRYMTITPTKT